MCCLQFVRSTYLARYLYVFTVNPLISWFKNHFHQTIKSYFQSNVFHCRVSDNWHVSYKYKWLAEVAPTTTQCLLSVKFEYGLTCLFSFIFGKYSISPFKWHSLDALSSHCITFCTKGYAFQGGTDTLCNFVITSANGWKTSCISNRSVIKSCSKGKYLRYFPRFPVTSSCVHSTNIPIW